METKKQDPEPTHRSFIAPNVSGAQLLQHLAAGDLPIRRRFVGVVKESKIANHVSFSPFGCDEWMDIPATLIAKAEVRGTRPCRDHSHPLVEITLGDANEAIAPLCQAMNLIYSSYALDESETERMNGGGIGCRDVGGKCKGGCYQGSCGRASNGVCQCTGP